MKIWTCGSSPRSGSLNAWTRIKTVNGAIRLSNFWNFFGRRDPNVFLSRLVTMDETTLYRYDPETNKNQWSDGIAAHSAPKNFRVQKSAGKFSHRFFGINKASSSLVIFHRAKLSTRSVNHLCWCNWRTFWRKSAAGSSSKMSCSCTTMSRLTGHLQPRRNWPTWASIVLITHIIPILNWLRLTSICFLDWKNIWKVAIFLPTRKSLLPRRPDWMDNFLNFFWVACKS